MENLDKLALEIADNKSAVEELSALLAAAEASALSSAQKKTLADGAEVFLETAELTPVTKTLLYQLARFDVPCSLISQKLLELTRSIFSSFPDPASLIEALGFNDTTTALSALYGRLIIAEKSLSEYADKKFVAKNKEQVFLYNAQLGFGALENADAVADVYQVQFNAMMRYTLTILLQKCHLVQSGCLSYDLLSKKKIKIDTFTSADLQKDFSENSVPALEANQSIVTRLVMPHYCKTVKAFQTWFVRKVAPGAVEKKVERNMSSVRSLAELKGYLTKFEGVLKITPEDAPNLKKIFAFAAGKALQNKNYTECAILLWSKVEDKTVLKEIITETYAEAQVWADLDHFIEASESLTAKSLPYWYEITASAKGSGFLVAAVLNMPLKHWKYIAIAVAEEEGDTDSMLSAIQADIKTGHVSADAVVWAYETYKKEHAKLFPVIGNPALVFRTLAKKMSGNFLKAQKDLRKLLLSNADFQKMLMDQGEESAILHLVGAAKNLAGIDSGERQSLLVHIVRCFPQAKDLIEDKTTEVKQGKLERVTSVRSFTIKKTELEDIVSRQIPENKEAIQVAREFGDLKENSEYKAAKEHQKYLQSRRAELEEEVSVVRPVDFSQVEMTGRIIPGTAVKLLLGGEEELYTVLGVWDSVPDKKYLSFETPMGQALISREAGEKLEFNGKEIEILEVSPLSKDVLSWLNSDAV